MKAAPFILWSSSHKFGRLNSPIEREKVRHNHRGRFGWLPTPFEEHSQSVGALKEVILDD
jgi:hypothetical protein